MRKKIHRYARWCGVTIAALVGGALLIGSVRDPHFWWTADQQGDALMKKGQFAEAAKVYADPMQIGVAQYRDGAFEAAAHSFARVPGADGIYNAGNAWLMHGQYDKAVSNYERALKLRPNWKEAEENRSLALARKKMLETSGENREQEQTEEDKPDDIVFDQKGGDQKKPPQDLSKGQELSDAQLQETWLRRVQTTPADFLKAKFAWQAHSQSTTKP